MIRRLWDWHLSVAGRRRFATVRIWLWWILIPVLVVTGLAQQTTVVTILSLVALALADAGVRAGIKSEEASKD